MAYFRRRCILITIVAYFRRRCILITIVTAVAGCKTTSYLRHVCDTDNSTLFLSGNTGQQSGAVWGNGYDRLYNLTDEYINIVVESLYNLTDQYINIVVESLYNLTDDINIVPESLYNLTDDI